MPNTISFPWLPPLSTHEEEPDRAKLLLGTYGYQVTQSQAALLSNHEVFVHLQAVQAEHDGTDGTGRERPQPPGLKNTLRDVS